MGNRTLLKYWAIFKTQLASRLAYPGDVAAQSFSIVIFMFVLFSLWRAVYAASGQVVISGLSLRQMTWYLMMTETILLSKPRFARTISVAVKDGSIAYLLNKPYHFLLYLASSGLGDSLVNAAFSVLLGGSVVWLLAGPPPDPTGWPLVMVAVIAGWGIDFCVAALIGLAAFVTEDVTAFEWIYQKMLFILGGMLIPLDFFPGWLRTASQLTPFAFTMYGPARLFVEPSLPRFAALLLGQVIWLVVLAGLVELSYRRGMVRLTINGG